MTPSSRPLAILRDLIAIPSVNPAYDPESAGESLVATYIAAWARALGLTVRRQEVLPGRDNILVRLAPEADDTTALPVLLLEAHMDTVSADAMTDAFVPAIRDGCLYGRGACDTKGSLAAMMAAVESLVEERDGLPCVIELLAAVDEETSGTGVRAHIAAGHRADGAIVGEPTGLRVIHAHNGCVRGEIVVTGRAAHTSVAETGVNAIAGMAEVVLALRDLNGELMQRTGGAAANGSLTVSLINGGTGINIVPEQCIIGYDRRTVPGDVASDVLAEIDDAVDRVRRARPDLRIDRREPALIDHALYTDPDAGIVQGASAANRSLGLDAAPTRVPYGSDASKLGVDGGIPAIVYGPGDIAQAHGAEEFVEVAQVEAAAAFYRAVALSFSLAKPLPDVADTLPSGT